MAGFPQRKCQHVESQRPVDLEWSAHHLHNQCLPLQSWPHLDSLLSNVGTTNWPWLIIYAVPRAPHHRYAQCLGFSDALIVKVSEWDAEAQTEQRWRLGLEGITGLWLDIDPLAEYPIWFRTSQVLTVQQAAVAFYDWLQLGCVRGFTVEEVQL
jgi:hypothetical protein